MRDGYRAMSVRCEQQPSPAVDTADRGSERLPLAPIALAVSVAVFYTWSWTLAAGATCGFALALCVALSRRLRAYAAALNMYLAGASIGDNVRYTQERVCAACGIPECSRHDPHLNLEPWAGLRLHKQLDQAIEDFYNAIIERFVSGWYGNITRQPFFLDELRQQLRYASAALVRRAYKIDYSKFIVDKLVPCALHHHGVWVAAQKHLDCSRDLHEATRDPENIPHESTVPQNDLCLRWRRSDASECQDEKRRRPDLDPPTAKDHRQYSLDACGVEAAALAGPLRCGLHPAARSRDEEMRYLRCVTAVIMPYLLRKEEVHNKVFQVLIREIFAGWVLLSLTDVLADPYILNTLIVLATGGETMSALPKTPNYRVEFLENFVRQSESQYSRRSRLLRVELETVLGSQEYLYAFMQYMKGTGHLHVLQFCKDIKPFQMKILNPDLTANEEVSLFNEAWDLYVQYFDADSPNAVSFQPSIVEEMREVLSEGPANVKKLQTSKALYQSSKYADSVLENIFIPKFLHSEEFYQLFFGPRIPTGYHKRMTKKPHEKLVSTAIKLGNKLKGALKTQTIDGQILDVFTNTIDITDAGVSETDAAENMNILQYLDSLAEHTKMEEHDLSNWRVALTGAEIRQLEGRRGSLRVFRVAAQHASPLSDDARPCGGGVERTESDFHLLRSKLAEFHGDTLLQELVLPSRRDNSPLETLRYKYEDFVQRLLQKRLLATSQLLHIFLSAEGDFALAVQRASLGAAGGSDLSNIYQSVAHRLRKEKGQHLEPFMNAFLLSSDMERYQAMKLGSSQAVEEAEEVDEVVLERPSCEAESAGPRDIRNDTFGNNYDLPRAPASPRPENKHQDKLTGFTQCFMFFLTKVVGARGLVCGVVGCVAALFRDLVDRSFNLLLNSVLADVLSHRRLAHLIRLGHELLFIDKQSGRQHSGGEQYERARTQLHAAAPRLLAAVLGPNLHPALDSVLHMLQQPRLNKQLVYKLLDLCIAELFPELVEANTPSLQNTS